MRLLIDIDKRSMRARIRRGVKKLQELGSRRSIGLAVPFEKYLDPAEKIIITAPYLVLTHIDEHAK